MKVLYVSHTSLVSGAEGALLDLLSALPADVQALLACPVGPLADSARISARCCRTAARLWEFSHRSVATAATVVQLLAAGSASRRIVAQQAPDMVHANTVRAPYLQCRLSAAMSPDRPLP